MLVTAAVGPSGLAGARRWVRRACLVLVGAAAATSLAASAWGFWSADGDGSGVAGTGTLTAPTNVTAVAPRDSATVAVSWDGSTLGTGQAAQGYYATRVRDSDGGTSAACGTSELAPVSALSCDDLGVVDGSYHYTVTAVFGSWTALSTAGNTVTLVNDASKPTVSVDSISPLPNGNGYNKVSPVVVNLSAASAGFAIASITYTLDSASPMSVPADTATVTVAGDGVHTLTFTATDTSVPSQYSETGSVLVRIDTVNPAAPSVPTLVPASDSGASATDGITKVTAPTFTGTAETGATITLYDGATTIGTGVAAGGVYTISSSTLAPATHAISARATDAAGNVGPASASATVTVDTVLPATPAAPTLTAASDSGTYSNDRNTNVTTPTFTGTAEAGATVVLYSSTTTVGSAVAVGGTYTVTSSVLTAGARTMTVKATDVAGNTSASSPSTAITIDITSPARPGALTLTAATDSGRSATDKITSVTAPVLTATITTGSVVTVYDAGAAVGTLTATSSTFQFTFATLSDGSHPVTAKATDLAGNSSALTAAVNVVIDTIAPAAPGAPVLATTSDSGVVTNDRLTNKTTPTITGSNESLATVNLYNGLTPVGTKLTAAATYSIVTSALGTSSHTLTATATDAAGNLGPASAGTTITIDTTAPAVPSTPALDAASDTGPSTSDRVTKDQTATFTGIAEAGISVRLWKDLGGTLSATGTVVFASGTGAYTATTSTLVAGTYLISARATDPAGNVSAGSTGVGLTLDRTAPTVTVNQTSGQADPTTAPPINFTIVFSEAAYWTTTPNVALTGTASPTTQALTGGGTTWNVAVGGMTRSGTVIAKVSVGKATDLAGNAVTASTALDGTVTYSDVTAPVVTISSFTPTGQTVAVSGTAGAGPGDVLTLAVDLCTVATVPCPPANIKVTLSSSVNASTGAWAVTSGSLGTNAALYAVARQLDLSANNGVRTAGPVATA